MACLEPEDEDYELLSVQGIDDLKIAVIPAKKRNYNGEGTGVRFCEWTISVDTFFLPKLSTELFGWYCESEKDTGGQTGNALFTSGTIKHSELIIVISNGLHLVNFENNLDHGKVVKLIIITKFVLINDKKLPMQINTFENSYVTSVQQHLDDLIVKFRIAKKQVSCIVYSQKGTVRGVSAASLNLVK